MTTNKKDNTPVEPDIEHKRPFNKDKQKHYVVVEDPIEYVYLYSYTDRRIPFEELPNTCQECLMSGRQWNPPKGDE